MYLARTRKLQFYKHIQKHKYIFHILKSIIVILYQILTNKYKKTFNDKYIYKQLDLYNKIGWMRRDKESKVRKILQFPQGLHFVYNTSDKISIQA